MEHNKPHGEPFLTPQSSSHMIQGSTGFGIHGGQFTNVQGNIIHQMVPYPANVGIILPGQQAASQTVVPNTPPPPAAVYSESGNYCKHLLRQCRGTPLYLPGPQVNLPAEYRSSGVAIGDVGRVTPEGGFDFLFNIYLPAHHPINAKVPHDFVPLLPYDLDDVAHNDFDPGNYVSSPSVTDINSGFPEFPGGEFIFNCVGPDGALLALPHGAHLEKLENLESMRRYAAKHAESWYKHVNGERGRGLVNGSLYLVTGCEKARSWGMASFQDVSLQTEFQLSFRPTTDAHNRYRYRWQGTRSHRKQADSPPDGTPLNQTIFIHAFAISVYERIWEKLFGVEVCQLVDSSTSLDQSGRSYVPFGSQESSFLSFFLGSSGYRGGRQSTGQTPALCDGVVTEASPAPKIIHPSQIIHERIFREVPQARVVITHDDDWCDAFKDDGTRPTEQNPAELQQAIFDRFKIVEEDGAVFLVDKAHATVARSVAPMGVSPAVAAPQHDKAESATVQSTFAASRRHPPQHRVSHPVVSSTSDHDQQPPTPMYTDVYSHPAAVAYAAAHPRRTIPKFGPYLLLQTLGEGEFGKVKLGLHIQWGEEVAIKLIRRGNVDTAVRMSKVEREIEVLRILRHPNIVRLYDVIETDKFIGIIIEYASGGELFDHILAHRYLRERDASKLFSQLISGVWYIHQKKIVHRDLKLENLLLDRHRNVIINDFGFANRFEHRADDLMQTSCGSPCYAAPELVISEGLYVGSAVDIWSCGVILYAMLAGYLPFDDDPANPDGDNINLLYKYIVNTPLSFPKYISDEARGLLKMMLVPDPRKRASLDDVMRHPWLAAYHMPRDDDEGAGPVAFGRTVDELEKAAMDQHRMKRLAYQRQMRAAAPTPPQPSIRRTMTEMLPTQSSGQAQNQVLPPPAQKSASGAGAPEFLYDSAYGAGGDDDDPFGPAPGSGKRAVAVVEESVETKGETPRGKGKEKQREEDTKDKFRHTIQIEYDARRGQRAAGGSGASPAPPTPVQDREREREHERSKTPTQTQSQSAAPPTPTPPHAVVLPLPSLVAAPPSPPAVNGAGGSPSAASIAERRERRQRGSTSSVNANAAGKPLPPSPTSPTSPPTTWKRMHEPTERVVGPSEVVNANVNWMAERPAVVDVLTDEQKEKAQAHAEGAEKEKEKETEKEADAEKEKEKERKEKEKEGKKSQRNTLTGLTVIVNPFTRRSRMREPSTNTSASPPTQLAPPVVPALPNTGSANKTFDDGPDGMKGRTNKARKVIQWIHKGRDSLTVPGPTSGVPSPAESMADSADTGDATSPVQVFVTTPAAAAAAGGAESLRIHHGAMDQGTVTTRQPPEVMRHVKEVLIGMGVEIFVESEYKYRCIRAKQRRNSKSTVGGSTGPGAPGGVGTFTMVGSSGSNGADKTLPLQSFFSGGAMLRGLLMPWESSQVSTAPSSTLLDGDDSLSASGILSAETASQVDTVYGTSVEDAGDEVRFSVELTRLNLLHDTYSLDIRRLKGNLRSYKFLYETLRKRADLQRQC